MAEPDGMFSVAAMRPCTSTSGASSGNARMMASTAAAPDMSSFMRSIPSAGLRSRPPESKVMPLPMTATRRRRRPDGVYERWMNFGGCPLPAATPRNNPTPIFWHAAPPPGRRGAPDSLEGQLDALAETDDHHPARGNAAAGVHMRDVRGLAGEPLGFQDFGELPAERLVDASGRLAQPPLFRVHADDDRVSLDRLQRTFRDVDFHAPPPGASAAARRIMSMSPSVVSMRSTSSIGTQRTSAASSPAMIVSSSDSGKAR